MKYLQPIMFFHFQNRYNILLLVATVLTGTVISAQAVPKGEETQSVLVDPSASSTVQDDPVAESPSQPTTTEAANRSTFRPTGFQGVVAGTTPESGIIKLLGEPRARIDTQGGPVLVYAIEPYDRVGIVLRGDVADSIHLHFKKPTVMEQVATELGLDQQLAVTQTTPSAQDLLLTWPDQGISLHFRRQGTANMVSRVSFTTAQPNPYLLRGLNRQWLDYAGALHDARAVENLDPQREDAYRLAAQVAFRMGDTAVAQQALTKAFKFTSDPIDLYLLQIALINDPVESDRILPMIRAIRNNTQLPALTRSKAAYAMGQINVKSAKPDYKQALVYHSEAIQRARGLMENQDLATQFAALRIMVDGHLAIARDINRGPYTPEEKNRVVPKWIEISWKLTSHLLANDYHDRMIGLEVCHQSLRILSQLSETISLNDWEDRLQQQITEVSGLVGSAPEFSDHAQWQRAMAMYYATLIARQGKDADRVQQLGLAAYQIFHKPLTAQTRFLYWDHATTHEAMVGLCYTMGSVAAVDELDHEKAVQWYDQAVTYLQTTNVQKYASSLGWHGERMVSMGLSYWKTGDRSQGLDLTKRGIAWIEQAIEDHQFPKQNLRIPYSNLSVMYRAVGQNQNAERIADAVDDLTKQR
ncbi:MAG: hypothetical protein VX738_11680 [Planctomycetota bacterium]|nr:hypothetical protein [Planctomycetota bacterium]